MTKRLKRVLILSHQTTQSLYALVVAAKWARFFVCTVNVAQSGPVVCVW